mmetsp:Transcript_4081/g.10395  ORF Transcript_4081/g.10395 Transcript_4081/m.10395 type:complete len:230 (-) Transcript_4081:382-1071(-)
MPVRERPPPPPTMLTPPVSPVSASPCSCAAANNGMRHSIIRPAPPSGPIPPLAHAISVCRFLAPAGGGVVGGVLEGGAASVAALPVSAAPVSTAQVSAAPGEGISARRLAGGGLADGATTHSSLVGEVGVYSKLCSEGDGPVARPGPSRTSKSANARKGSGLVAASANCRGSASPRIPTTWLSAPGRPGGLSVCISRARPVGISVCISLSMAGGLTVCTSCARLGGLSV